METIFCCRKCRRGLFRESNLLSDEHDTGKNEFSLKRVECTSHFLKEPEAWMTLTEQDGKLVCPQCETRFGTYIWSGTQCSCGEWVVPGIQIPKSKVDPRKIKLEQEE